MTISHKSTRSITEYHFQLTSDTATPKCPDTLGKVITWSPAKRGLPDSDITVLVHLADGEVWTGFHDAGQWRFVSADPISEPVLHWMPFPQPPEVSP